MILYASMMLMSQLTVQQQQALCFTFADLGVATIEAHEGGVPLEKVLSVLDDDHVPAIIRPSLRDGILKEYANPPTGIAINRPLLVDQFAAKCMLEEFKD